MASFIMNIIQRNSIKKRLVSKNPLVLKQVNKQSGKLKDYTRDFSREALPPGKRISKNGKVYWETRKNRSDKVGSKV